MRDMPQTPPKISRRGLLVILSSPSGAGKSTLAKRLREWDPSVIFSVSATTRAPRTGEVDGEDYHFMSEAAFKKAVANGEMLEHAHVFGNFYGSPKGPVRDAIIDGKDVLFDIDWRCVKHICKQIGYRNREAFSDWVCNSSDGIVFCSGFFKAINLPWLKKYPSDLSRYIAVQNAMSYT
mgnify:CR=1 FL=1